MSSLASNRVFLKRQGRRVELQLEQVTVDHLRRILQVDPTDVWLLDDLDDTAFFPDDDGTFRGLSCLRTLEVQGPSVASPELGSSSNGVTVSATSTSSGPHVTPRPQFKSVISSRGKNYPVFRLKVVKAIMEGGGGGKCKPSFQTIQQTYIELQESTANVHYVRDEVSRTWGSLYVLVTSDGLQLEDSPATRGLAFWKAPRRNVYAVLKDSCRKSIGKHGKHRHESDDDTDEDFEPKMKRSKYATVEKKMDLLLEEFETIKATVSEVMQLSRDTKMPIGLSRVIRDTFSCRICRATVINPPVILSKCCKTLLGCESCVNQWYRGPDALTKSCPSCRFPRGYNETLLIRGVDDFLKEIKKLTSDDEESEDTPEITDAD